MKLPKPQKSKYPPSAHPALPSPLQNPKTQANPFSKPKTKPNPSKKPSKTPQMKTHLQQSQSAKLIAILVSHQPNSLSKTCQLLHQQQAHQQAKSQAAPSANSQTRMLKPLNSKKAISL